jgi:hypothetical protein|tara:strand:+ start:221 stop:619 length:399 start_codon:yes stop_codon:yes gene_type:complete
VCGDRTILTGTKVSLMEDWEIYQEVEKTIDWAFDHKFFLNMYEYLRSGKAKKTDVQEFLNSSTTKEINDIIHDLDDYIVGGSDEEHRQLREGYGHLGKPEARKIRNYLQGILDDARKYGSERQSRKRRNFSK